MRSQRSLGALRWLPRSVDRAPRFIVLYFEDVDTGNHRAGPGIARPGMTNDVNVIVVSDHGTAPIARERTVFLDDYVSMDSLELIDTSPVMTIMPKPGRDAYVYRRLKNASPHLSIYRKADVPARVDGSIDSVRALLRR